MYCLRIVYVFTMKGPACPRSSRTRMSPTELSLAELAAAELSPKGPSAT